MQLNTDGINNSLYGFLSYLKARYKEQNDTEVFQTIVCIDSLLKSTIRVDSAVNALEITASLLVKSYGIVNQSKGIYRPFADIRNQGVAHYNGLKFSLVQPPELPLREKQLPYGFEFVQNRYGLYCLVDRDNRQPSRLIQNPQRIVLSIEEITGLAVGYAQSEEFKEVNLRQ